MIELDTGKPEQDRIALKLETARYFAAGIISRNTLEELTKKPFLYRYLLEWADQEVRNIG